MTAFFSVKKLSSLSLLQVFVFLSKHNNQKFSHLKKTNQFSDKNLADKLHFEVCGVI